MYRRQLLANLRSLLSDNGIDAMILPANDPHFGEYVPDHYKQRAYVSGFTGEAGTLAVTREAAALWTDSRFFIAATAQLAGSEIQLMKLKVEGTPTIAGWLEEQLPSGAKVAVDGNLYSLADFRALSADLGELELVAVEDPFDLLWPDRPQLPFNPIELMPEKYCGVSVAQKHAMLCSKFEKYGAFAYIVSACDQVMWLFNIRGTDVEYNTLAMSYAVVTPSEMYLFIGEQALTPQVDEYLTSQDVTICAYSEFRQFLKAMPKNIVRITPLIQFSWANYLAAGGDDATFVDDSADLGYISYLRSRKNPVEIEGYRKAFLLDGIAWTKVLKYIDDNVQSGTLDEWNVAQKFVEMRSQSEFYCGESFEPIVAYQANAAAPHYAISKDSCARILPEGFLLMDTGGHYDFGTTDTTRTVSFGELTREQKDDYTLIVKGMIQLTLAKFPAGTRGAQLDILARGPIFTAGKMYWHGTGHGVGHKLCVHESPQFRMEESPIVLDRGMIMTDEPGVYLEGRYGIRTENVNLIVDFCKNEGMQYFQFEPLTLVPIETRLINKELLGAECTGWLNSYNRRVAETLAPYLSEEERLWLAGRVTEI